MTVGRPSEYDQGKADAICDLLSRGWSIRRVVEHGHTEYRDINFPSAATIFKWMRENEEFLKQYARAKQEAADAMAEEILDIADDGRNDAFEDEDGKRRIDFEHIQRSKLRVDTRKFLMAKMKPKRYGDKLDLTSDGERLKMEPIVISTIKARNAKSETEAASGS